MSYTFVRNKQEIITVHCAIGFGKLDERWTREDGLFLGCKEAAVPRSPENLVNYSRKTAEYPAAKLIKVKGRYYPLVTLLWQRSDSWFIRLMAFLGACDNRYHGSIGPC